MSLWPPINDPDCLLGATIRAGEIGEDPRARGVAQRLGSLGRVVEQLRQLPQLDDDGRSYTPGAIACNVWQRARGFPPNPNCFERAIHFAALAGHLAPSLPVRLGTLLVEGLSREGAPLQGLHTVPFVWDRNVGAWSLVDLDPGSRHRIPDWLYSLDRNAESGAGAGGDGGAGGFDWRMLTGLLHSIGKGVLSIYGMGGLGDQIGGLEKQAGVI